MIDPSVRGRLAARVAFTALAYAAVAWAALTLTVDPGFATPLYPSAGIALAASLAYGRVGLIGTALGSVAVNLIVGASQGTPSWQGAMLAAAIGAGAALQAMAGTWLIRRFVAQPLVLSEPVDVARFFLFGAPLACTVSASIGVAALTAAGAVPVDLAGSNWWNWWVGDTLGVLIAAPAVLTLIGQPEVDWRRRRLTVALPLLMATLFLAAATSWASRADDARLRAAFERDAWSLANTVQAGLRPAQDALTAVHGLLSTHPKPDSGLVAQAAEPWLKAGSFIQAIGWSARVRRDDLPAFEADARAEGPKDYRVFDRPESTVAATDAEVVALRYIEPAASNVGALGVNALSIPAARTAILQAAASGRTVATAGFRLTQSNADETGVVLYRALAGEPQATGSTGSSSWRGIVFVTLRLDALVNGLLQTAPSHLDWCLTDSDPASARRRLAGAPGCEIRKRGPYAYLRPLSLAGREYEMTVSSTRAALPDANDVVQKLFSLAGLAATTLLGALLLVGSGRQQRFESAVRERTQELELAGRALRQSEERLRNTLDHLPVGVFQADADGRILDVNPDLAAMLGIRHGEAVSHRIGDLVHEEDRQVLKDMIAKTQRESASSTQRRLRLLDADGTERPVQMTLSPLHAVGDAKGQVIGVVEDITGRLQLEASERALHQAEAANRAKNEFVGRMSHELRTPLNAMLGFSQLLEVDTRPALSVHQRGWARQVQTAGWHLLAMINDTLDLSMIESGAVQLAPAPLVLADLLHSAQDLVAEAAQRRQLRIHPPVIDQGAEFVFGDPTRVVQILTNLLSNAIKYNTVGGSIRITAHKRTPDLVEIGIQDEGAGLSADQLEHLFEPFNRLGQTQSGIEGTGIGLVISRRLAELMGGSLSACSTLGQGSTFLLRVPRADQPASSGPATPVETEPASYPSRRVHYVEDNQINIGLVRNVIARRPQVELTVSMRGGEGLTDIQRLRPDLVLLDMHLPDIDGIVVLRRLKSDPATAKIPVLVLSADATRDRIDAALREGAAGYLSKPLDIHELLSTVDELLAASRA